MNDNTRKTVSAPDNTKISAGTKLKNKLSADYPNLWDSATKTDQAAALEFSEEYKAYIDLAKTEREFVNISVETLESMGYKPVSDKKSLKPGDKVYRTIRNKGLVAALIGSEPLVNGVNLVGAHIDCPRLDLKPNPIYEDNDFTYMKTHYYGGIKKYQWAAIPLALHGLVIRKDGSPLSMSIGEDDDDPVLTITDLLPHLGVVQMKRKATEIIKGEELNVLVGSQPYPDKELAGRFKLNILKLLHDKYDLVEKDFVSAEIEIVPAGRARDVGLDRSMIGAYGHDDRICAFPGLAALTDFESAPRTVCLMLFDKEETGSDGNTGAQSRAYENCLLEMLHLSQKGATALDFARMLENSKMLSADVSNAFDPTFPQVSDSRNNSFMGRGITLTKYTGSRGKSGTSDANAEFFAGIIRLFNEKKIPWQTGELGKVDEGGGGTVAKYLANTGMEVIDCGIPVLSMHSPFEIASKIDLYFTYLAYKTFLGGI